MKNIITIQHTQSIHHINGMVGSWTDWDLTESGKRQARQIGKRLLAEISGEQYLMHSSDLLCARNTAEIDASHLNITLIIISVLRERNLGAAVGKSVKWLKENMECQEKTADDRMFRNAVSRKAAWNRLLSFYNQIMQSKDKMNLL
jgi:broad specificity phosphatase PhoE